MMFDPQVWQPRPPSFKATSALYSSVRKLRETPAEIEVKLRIANVATILERLKRMGAVSHGRVLERNILFDTPKSDFWRRKRLLRVRIARPAPKYGFTGRPRQAVLTSKAPAAADSRSREPQSPQEMAQYKVRAEREVVLSKPTTFLRKLENLGLRPGFCYDKFRTNFVYEGLHLDLDETSVGTFLELEGKPAKIDRAAKMLGFSTSDYVRATYWDLYAADCRRRGVAPRNMLLPNQKLH